MAIAMTHIVWLLNARRNLPFPKNPSILEIGEQNWFGDINPLELKKMIDGVAPQDKRTDLHIQFDAIQQNPDATERSFDLAKFFYRMMFDYERLDAVDLHGTASSIRHDLNYPLQLDRQYDMVFDIGTAEHIFSVGEVFRNIHNVTKPGGFMLHALPNQGSYDHGFFNFHPTFFFDLCLANNYTMDSLFFCTSTEKPPRMVSLNSREDYVRLALDNKLSLHSGLLAIMRKAGTEAPFALPRQGFYDNSLSPELQAAWKELVH